MFQVKLHVCKYVYTVFMCAYILMNAWLINASNMHYLYNLRWIFCMKEGNISAIYLLTFLLEKHCVLA